VQQKIAAPPKPVEAEQTAAGGSYDARPLAGAISDIQARDAGRPGRVQFAAFRSISAIPLPAILNFTGTPRNMWQPMPTLPLGRVALAPQLIKILRKASAVSATPVRAVTPAVTVGPVSAEAPVDAMKLLKAVNKRVNGHVIQRHDIDIYGQGELWRPSGTGKGAQGDCEDIAIEKRLQLIAEGFPPEKLAYAVTYRREVGLHTVLIARTDQGDMVLDSLTPYIVPWGEAAYSWVGLQSMSNPSEWHALGPKG
jgi:predicted transglutaminase-like cysteine proteinase